MTKIKDTQNIFNFSHCLKMKPKYAPTLNDVISGLMTSLRVGEQKRSRGGGDIKFLPRHPTLLNRQQSSTVSYDVSPLFLQHQNTACVLLTWRGQGYRFIKWPDKIFKVSRVRAVIMSLALTRAPVLLFTVRGKETKGNLHTVS